VRKCLSIALILASTLIGGLSEAGAAGPSTAPLLQSTDLTYVGAFRVPPGDYGSPQWTGFNFGGTAPAYNASNNSLFLVGHGQYQLTAEISIPKPVTSTTYTGLPVASIVSPFVDATGGLIRTYGTTTIIGGQLVYQGRLIGTEYIYYDANNTQTAAHFARPSTSLTSGTVTGLFAVWDRTKTGYVSGYLASVPPEWQSLLGGPVLVGNCCIPIIGRTSVGPSAFAMDAGAYGTATTPATPLLYYTVDHQTLGSWSNSSVPNPIFNQSTTVRGMILPQGTRTLLFFGGTGMGIPCYGEGTNDQSLDRQPLPGGGGNYCYDPAISAKGTHAYPYSYYVWAYDVNDLVAVKNGDKQPWELTPYAHWPLRLPIADPAQLNQLGGATYDPATGRIYVSQIGGESAGFGRLPVVHVFQIGPGTTSLPAPSSLSVK
jgi:hypothetical protein